MRALCLSLLLLPFTHLLSQEALPLSCLKSGIYLGSQFGYSWIASPSKSHEIESCDRGHFAWGISGGYNLNILKMLSFGLEVGYNDNGRSTLTFASHNRYEITSRDWNLLATTTYLLCPNFGILLKGGAAQVTQRFCRDHIVDSDHLLGKTRERKFLPTASLGLTTCFCHYFFPFITYRGVFGHNQRRFPKKWCGRNKIATVHSVMTGLSVNF